MLFFCLPVQETVALPVKPGLHLQTKCPGRLQHSALSAHKAASEGTSHSLMSTERGEGENKNTQNTVMSLFAIFSVQCFEQGYTWPSLREISPALDPFATS